MLELYLFINDVNDLIFFLNLRTELTILEYLSELDRGLLGFGVTCDAQGPRDGCALFNLITSTSSSLPRWITNNKSRAD